MQDRFKTFTVLIAKLNRSIHKIKSEEMREYDLKSPHVSCLYYLYGQEGLTAKKLCEICDEDKAAISRSVEYLEESGYIYCECNAKKRYNSPLYLTEKGKEVAKSITKKIDRVLFWVSQGLNEEDRNIMYKSLLLICNNLQTFCEKYGD